VILSPSPATRREREGPKREALGRVRAGLDVSLILIVTAEKRNDATQAVSAFGVFGLEALTRLALRAHHPLPPPAGEGQITLSLPLPGAGGRLA
jgi:hypothetical protein